MANDLCFTEITIAALLGNAAVAITSRDVHTLDSALIMAADTVSGYIQALIEGAELSFTHYALDRSSRKAALARFLAPRPDSAPTVRSEEHTSELQSLMRNSYAVFCLKKQKHISYRINIENYKH